MTQPTFTDQDLLIVKLTDPDRFNRFLSHSGADSSITVDEILQNPRYACAYAICVIQHQWALGEQIILTSPNYSWLYARHVIEGPWPKGEDIISQDPTSAVAYANEFFSGQGWPRGEYAISRNGNCSYYYAIQVLGRPWPRGEYEIFLSGYSNFYLDIFPERAQYLKDFDLSESMS